MSLSKAIKFLKKVGPDAEYRKNCLQYETKSQLLADKGFNETEFEDALNMQLVKCQTYEEIPFIFVIFIRTVQRKNENEFQKISKMYVRSIITRLFLMGNLCWNKKVTMWTSFLTRKRTRVRSSMIYL